ncbi:MAG: methionine aminopeptidase [uncultured bacterium]|nr:MAG: methionine aminopeptidase [uncultured bacterium]HBD05284.1 type I methionyl aminopeptidase [Candidatus Uhrbacteria bacterium]
MALIKTKEEIKYLAEGGKLLSRALRAAMDAAVVGAKIEELDSAARKIIASGGGTPSFLGYKVHKLDMPFPTALCVSVNDEIVHGPANRHMVLKKGDLVGLDLGCWYEMLCTDMAATVCVGEVLDERHAELLKYTRVALEKGIEQAKAGNRILDISAAIERVANEHKFGIVRTLVGHGVGHEVHEEPHVPNFVDKRFDNMKLVPGMCLALEPMFTLGSGAVETSDDGWTIRSSDSTMTAHFEATIAITKEGPKILTPIQS